MKIRNYFMTIILFLFCSQSIHSQETFLRKYPSLEDKRVLNVFETNDNHIIFCGSVNFSNGVYYRVGTLSKITFNGELVDARNHNYTNGNSLFAEIITTPIGGNYYLLGSQDTVSNYQTISKVFIHTIDNEMNIVDLQEYGTWTDYNNFAWEFEVVNDSIAYILSILTHQNTGKYNYLLIRANLINGSFAYYLPDDNIFKAATSLIIDESNELVKVNYRIFYQTMYPWNPIANISYDLSNIEVVMPENDFFSQTKIEK